MKGKFLRILAGITAAVFLLTGCGSNSNSDNDRLEWNPPSTNDMSAYDVTITNQASYDDTDVVMKLVGVSMPGKDLQRWNQDGTNMEKELTLAGYRVDLRFASNDVQKQIDQVKDMVDEDCDVLVIAAIEGSSLTEVLETARDRGIPVIAYDRLIMDSDAVSYYATFDNYMVGTVQGEYIRDQLDLDNSDGPFSIEITAGDPGDNNARFFYGGAYDVLEPYITSGKLNVVSGQTSFEDCATPTWASVVAQTRAEEILNQYYSDGTELDAWVCSNDSTALGVEHALAAKYTGKYPIITGQDCDIENTKNMISGKQSMSVFKDTRTLATQTVKMVGQILEGETVDVNDTETYNNNVITVPSYLCEPVFADANNYKEILIDSGYYKEEQLK